MFGGQTTDELLKARRAFPKMGVVLEALPVVVGAAETVAEGEPLTLFTCVRRGAVPGEVGEDAQGPCASHERHALGHIFAIALRNQS